MHACILIHTFTSVHFSPVHSKIHPRTYGVPSKYVVEQRRGKKNVFRIPNPKTTHTHTPPCPLLPSSSFLFPSPHLISHTYVHTSLLNAQLTGFHTFHPLSKTTPPPPPRHTSTPSKLNQWLFFFPFFSFFLFRSLSRPLPPHGRGIYLPTWCNERLTARVDSIVPR